MASRAYRGGQRRLAQDPTGDARGPVVGVRAVTEALRAHRRELRALWWRRTRAAPRPAISALLALAERANVPVHALEPAEFDRRVERRESRAGPRLPGTVVHQGVALDAGPIPTLTLQQLPEAFAAAETLVALDGVEDPQNLGAIARVAAAAGVQGLILTKRRCAPLSAATARASAGAIEHLQIAVVPNLREALARLQKLDFEAVGADPDGDASLYQMPSPREPHARVLVLGGEGAGLRPNIQAVLDRRLRIPMAEPIESLNVSAAAAVVLFEWRRQALTREKPPGGF